MNYLSPPSRRASLSMLKRSSIRHSDPTLSQKRGELRHCGGHSIISGESINAGARGTLFDAFASSFNRGRARNRYLHAVRSNCQPAVRVSPDISMNKVTSVTLNFRAPRSIPPPVEIPLSTNHSRIHRNSRHNISARRSLPVFFPPLISTVVLITVRIILG